MYAGDKFVAKQADNKRKKKLKKVEEKMLGWGRFLSYTRLLETNIFISGMQYLI